MSADLPLEAARMPVLFIGHGTPLNALRDNDWTQSWARLGRELPRPRAILLISAHWCTEGVAVTGHERPPTLHDFGYTLQPLLGIRYPAPGSPVLAGRVCELLAHASPRLDHAWGLDHGAWSVLCKVFPEPDIPVVQLSVDDRMAPEFHLDLGRALAPLRDEGVLIIASGNIVHNLRLRIRDSPLAFNWAVRFDAFIRSAALAGDWNALARYRDFGAEAELSVPTPDHFYPLLYACGAAGEDRGRVEAEGICQGSMSMLSLSFGRELASSQPDAAPIKAVAPRIRGELTGCVPTEWTGQAPNRRSTGS